MGPAWEGAARLELCKEVGSEVLYEWFDQHLLGVPQHLQAWAFKQVASISVCLLPSPGVLVTV